MKHKQTIFGTLSTMDKVGTSTGVECAMRACKSRLFVGIMILVVFSGSADCAFGAVRTWTGTNGTDWAEATNWSGNTAPANNTYTDTARFADTDPSPVNKTPTLLANGNILAVSFENSVGWTVTGSSYTLSLRVINSSGVGVNSFATILQVVTEIDHTWTISEGSQVDLLTDVKYFGYNAAVHAITITGGGHVVFCEGFAG